MEYFSLKNECILTSESGVWTYLTFSISFVMSFEKIKSHTNSLKLGCSLFDTFKRRKD